MKHRRGYIVGVSIQGVETLFGLVVPYLDQPVIPSGNEVGFVSLVVIHAVYPEKMAGQREICLGARSEIPHLNALIQRATSKGVKVSWVEGQLHHIMDMILQGFHQGEVVVPIPDLDRRVIRGGQDVTLRGMDHQASDVIRVRVKSFDLLHCVVVEHANLEIVTPANQPLFSCDETGCPDWGA